VAVSDRVGGEDLPNLEWAAQEGLERERELVTKITVWLLCAVILLLMAYFLPEPQACFVPPNAPTRGLYDSCWGFWDLWG